MFRPGSSGCSWCRSKTARKTIAPERRCQAPLLREHVMDCVLRDFWLRDPDIGAERAEQLLVELVEGRAVLPDVNHPHPVVGRSHPVEYHAWRLPSSGHHLRDPVVLGERATPVVKDQSDCHCSSSESSAVSTRKLPAE